MDPIEYEVTFISFFIGLGVADLFSSLIKMMKKRRVVRLHPLPLLWITVAFTGLIVAWFAYYGIVHQEIVSSAPGFILAISPAVFIFAFTVSVVPHDIPAEGIDLKNYYFEQQRLIFTLLSLDIISRGVTWYVFFGSNNGEVYVMVPIILLLLALVIGMIFIKNIGYHWIVGLMMLLFNLGNIIGQNLRIN